MRAPRAARSRGTQAPRPGADRPRRATPTDTWPMVALAYRGASSSRLRTHPLNLIRSCRRREEMDPTLSDDRRLRLGGRRRDSGGPEGVRGRGLLRDERDRRADGPEHARRRSRPGAAAGLRRGPARGRLRRHRRRRSEDGDALLARADRDGCRLPLGAPCAARRRPGDGRKLRREAAARTTRLTALVDRLFPLATVVTPNLLEAEALVGASGTRHELARAHPRARRACGDRHRRARRGRGRPPLRRPSEHVEIEVERHDVAATHGAGCTHSATLAALLARGEIARGRRAGAARVASEAVRNGLVEIGAGEGPVNVLA